MDPEFIHYINQIETIFRTYMEGIGPKTNRHYNHPALNCRYGLELEFLASSNRYVIGNRINNCMFNKNGDWWRNNFNALAAIPPNLPQDPNRITNNDSFDQYSSFFVECTDGHGAASHRGQGGCDTRGNAGSRIENDSSVELDPKIYGLTLWSNNGSRYHQGTELKSEGDIWNDNVRGFHAGYTISNYNQIDTTSSQHTRREDIEWNYDGDEESMVDIHEENELVTPILTNDHINYPYGRAANGDIQEKLLPLGSLLMDNLVNHMKAHTTVLATQEAGFHVHLSEFPKIQDARLKKEMVIGFVKLFYIFEPLIYSFHPYYRSISTYCQSIQSIFTFDEIVGNDIAIWNDLVNDNPIGGSNRKDRGDRYVSVNLQNLKPGGIGTIEIRIGHCSFSSEFIQAYVNILQILFRLNMALLERQRAHDVPGNLYGWHNWLLNKTLGLGIIPAYCNQSTNDYNAYVMDKFEWQKNGWYQGRPLYGFFASGQNNGSRTTILERQYQFLYSLTSCRNTLEYLCSYTNYYHSTSNDWLCYNNINDIDFNNDIDWMRGQIGRRPADENFFSIRFVTQERDYYLNSTGAARGNSYLHRCKCCSSSNDGQCGVDYNGGEYLDLIRPHNNRDPVRDPYNEGSLYANKCNYGANYSGNWYYKVQTELIDFKTAGPPRRPRHEMRYGHFSEAAGGARRPKRKTQKLKKIKCYGGGGSNTSISLKNPRKKISMNNIKMSSNNSRPLQTPGKNTGKKPDWPYRVNSEGANIVITTNKNKVLANYANWMGDLLPDEKLSLIINTLISKNIIDMPTIELLSKYKYLDYYVFLNETPVHKKSLVLELAHHNIDENKIENIRTVYKEIAGELNLVAPPPKTKNSIFNIKKPNYKNKTNKIRYVNNNNKSIRNNKNKNKIIKGY